jgi:dienelactone hydrolase
MIARFLLLSVALACAAVEAQVSPKPEHAASRLDGWKLVAFEEDMLRFEVTSPADARLVLHTRDPLVVEPVNGGTASIRPGWDGTIGYSHYGLELSAKQAGEFVVSLRRILPPDKPQPTTAAELSRFFQRLEERSSRPPEDADEVAAWQQRYRAKLTEALMGGPLPPRVRLEPSVIETKDFPKFTLRRVQYRSQKDRSNELLLSIPKQSEVDGERRKVPVLLALHGHEAPWGEADERAYHMGHDDDFIAYFAEREWAVLQPATMNHALQHKDSTLQGEWTWDAIVALDYAATVPEIDMNRVGVCGLSTGAHLTMNVLALDERAKAGVVGCILSTWNHNERRFRIPPHCDCGIHGQLSGLLEQCDWAALAAPKPVMFQHGKQDAAFCPGADETHLDLAWNTGILPQPEYDAMFAEVARVWTLAGKPAQVETRIHSGPHSVDNATAWKWLNDALSGTGVPGRTQ